MKKVAITRLSALGDIVNSAFVLQFIDKHCNDTHITWICEEVFAPLLQTHPLVHRVHTVNLKKLKKEKSFSSFVHEIASLRKLGDFAKIIDMQGLLKSAIVSRVVGKNTHGFAKDSIREPLASLLYRTTTHIPYEENVVLRNAKVVSEALGFTITEEMIKNKEPVFPILHPTKLQKGNKNVAFVIGASWESKRYPKEKVCEVINALEINAHIIWGNETEKKEAKFIAKKCPNAQLAEKMSLTQLVSFISACDLLIGNDTGPTHMAWAQNIPSITIFGPTNERMIFQTPHNIAIHSPSKVDINKIDKNDYSIREIDPQEIITQAQRLLHGI